MEQKVFKLDELSKIDGDAAGAPGSLIIPTEAVFDLYQPIDPPTFCKVGNHNMVIFGQTGAFGHLLVDLATGHVVEQIRNDPEVALVNTSLAAFTECLKAFINNLPLGELEDEDEVEERNAQVAREIENALRRIDPKAYTEDSFWYEARWGVAIGNFTC
ncbi:SUKH-4 family immunity protein [Streptomyces pseudogriseolus]|uniref:SUKH-4 family immunity protein n=1 Tax=Streptomyces pseudogriseolus TaxID=36817 RepID=UPI0034953B4E